MRIFAPKDWSITTRLSLIAVLPVLLMFVSVVFYSYYSRYAEVQQELNERGHLVASALAESSEYGVISGNVDYLERTIHGLLQVDNSISKIEVLNVDKKTVVQEGSNELSDGKNQLFEAKITKELVVVNSFDDDDKPHLSASLDSTPDHRSREMVGYVRVTMSPSSLLVKQRQRILVGSAIAGTALLVSAVLGLYMAFGLTRPLAKTIAAVRQIRGGNYDVQLDVTVGAEIGDLQSAIVEMAGSLDQFRRDLEGKVVARTCALEAARDEAIKSNAEKRRLIQKVNSVVEEERRNIAIEIHDHLNAELIVVRLEAERILALVENIPTNYAIEEIKERANSIIKLTRSLYEIARDIVRRLRPEIIDTLGLRDAIEEMVRHYDNLHPQIRFGFQAAGNFTRLKEELEITAYRLIQEALSNVVKHSAATVAAVHLVFPENKKVLRINISDNGKGFDPQTVEPGIGLIGMRERVDSVGGRLEIHSAVNEGTTIIIELPVHEDQISN